MIHGITERQQESLALYYPQGVPFSGEITYEIGGQGIKIRCERGACSVQLARENLFGRSLILLEESFSKGGDFSCEEKPAYRDLGVMVDCSRNAVPRPKTLEKLLVMLSKMGYTVVQLYMEDTFELPGYPYFGWRRGGYTRQELRSLDQFAGRLGIELIPAIQTLAHLGQTLKWEAFRDMVDFQDILLADCEKTYALLDRIFDTLSSCFTSRRINIGMDEAHMVGLGNYLTQHGYQDRLSIMLRHFGKVHGLANQYGLHPMLWSDMFFRFATGGDYYQADCAIDPSVAKAIPEDTSLVYWDYYSQDQGIYDGMLEKHSQLCGIKNVIFAGGAWKWTGFCPNNGFSFQVAALAHESCKAHNVDEVLVTAWGDNGAECSLFAVLPAFQNWAELCYGSGALKDHFTRCCGGSMADFMALDEPVFTPGNPSPGKCSVNPPKYLFYQDVLCGLFDAHLQADSYAAHFQRCAEQLEQIVQRCEPQWRSLFETHLRFCRALAVKCRVGLDLRAAYESGNRDALELLTTETLPKLLEQVREFSASFRRHWLWENKAAGLDIIDLRIGGLEKRIQTAIERVRSYLNGETDFLEELEEPLLPFSEKEKGDLSVQFWHNIVSPDNIALI